MTIEVAINLPTDDEVHLWFTSLRKLDVDREPLEDMNYLSHDELEKYSSFNRPDIACRYKRGRTLLRQILAGYLGISPEDLQFDVGCNGKPILVSPKIEGLDFNLSHDADVIALAVVWDAEIGIDVSAINRAPAALRISRFFYSVAEQREINEADTEAPLLALKLWVLKESIVKAIGSHIWSGLSDTSLSIAEGHIHWASPPPVGDEADWHLELGYCGENNLLALAYRSKSSGEPQPLNVSCRVIGEEKYDDNYFRQCIST